MASGAILARHVAECIDAMGRDAQSLGAMYLAGSQGHCNPSRSGSRCISRLRYDLPPPQGTSQSPYSDHSEIPQSHLRKLQVFVSNKAGHLVLVVVKHFHVFFKPVVNC